MKTLLRLCLSCVLTIVMSAYVLLPAQSSIVSPRIGQPAIVVPGESLAVRLKTNIPYWRPGMELTLVSRETKQSLTVAQQTNTTNELSITTLVPQSIAPGSYDLNIKFGDENLRREKAVHVLAQYPQELSIIQLADLPTLGGDGSGDKMLAKLITEINLINPSVVLFTGDLAYGESN